MLSWDKLFELLIGFVTATVTIGLTMGSLAVLSSYSDKQQERNSLKIISYDYTQNNAINTGYVTTYNPFDKNGNGEPDYLEAESEVVDTSLADRLKGNLGDIYTIDGIVAEMPVYSGFLDISIEFLSSARYYNTEAMTLSEAQNELLPYLKHMSESDAARFRLEIKNQDGIEFFVFVEVGVITNIKYNTGDVLNYSQVQEVVNLANKQFNMDFVTKEGGYQRYNKGEDVDFGALLVLGYNTTDTMRIEILKTNGNISTIIFHENTVQIGSPTGPVIPPGDPTLTNPTSPIYRPISPEITDTNSFIDWTRVCAGERMNAVTLGTGIKQNDIEYKDGQVLSSLGYGVVQTYNPHFIFTKDALKRYRWYTDGFVPNMIINSSGVNTTLNNDSVINSISGKYFTMRGIVNQTGKIQYYSLKKASNGLTSNANGVRVTWNDLVSLMNGVGTDFTIYYDPTAVTALNAIDLTDPSLNPVGNSVPTISNSLTEDQIAQSKVYPTSMNRMELKNNTYLLARIARLLLLDDSHMIYATYEIGNTGQVVYRLTMRKNLQSDGKDMPYIDNAAIDLEALKAYVTGFGNDINFRVQSLNGVIVDISKGQSPTDLLRYIDGNSTTGIYRIGYNFQLGKIVTVLAIEYDPLDNDNTSIKDSQLQATQIPSFGKYYSDYNKYANKDVMGCP